MVQEADRIRARTQENTTNLNASASNSIMFSILLARLSWMQQRPSRLRNTCQQRGKEMADDMLFIEHSHLMGKGVSAIFFIRIRASCSFLQISPSFFSQKIINIADCQSVLAIVCNYFYIFVVGIWRFSESKVGIRMKNPYISQVLSIKEEAKKQLPYALETTGNFKR